MFLHFDLFSKIVPPVHHYLTYLAKLSHRYIIIWLF